MILAIGLLCTALSWPVSAEKRDYRKVTGYAPDSQKPPGAGSNEPSMLSVHRIVPS